jgi:hypothetical protein
VPQQELDGSEIAGSPINHLLGVQRRLGSNQLAPIPWCGGSASMVRDTVLQCIAPEAKPPAMNLGCSAEKPGLGVSPSIFVSLPR